MKTFNTTGRCIPEKHYMVNIDDKLSEISRMVDQGYYFVINRGRQYGKTTTLQLLAGRLKQAYAVISLDFQKLSTAQFGDEAIFSRSFVELMMKTVNNTKNRIVGFSEALLKDMEEAAQKGNITNLGQLFHYLSDLCDTAEKPVVLMIDEVDSASNNQVFLDFLAQLRGYYLDRDETSTFHSVILAGVYDIKNLELKIRPESTHRYNSPWNIAETFDVDMSFSQAGIAGMLQEYEADHNTGMDIRAVSQCIYEYTSGYPFLVSLTCKTIDSNVRVKNERLKGNAAWSADGVREAVKLILNEQTTLFESLIKQINTYPELRDMLYSILFQGSRLAYNPYNNVIDLGEMFGYIEDDHGAVKIANRIFEMSLYNYFLSEEELTSQVYLEAQKNKNQFIRNGMLDMDRVIEKFVSYYSNVYGDNDQKFVENYGRKLFLLYLKPIINGTGNYYIEAETRDAKRTDVIVDYLGKQFVIEMKIWNGEKYNSEGEEQIAGYLERYHLKKGYLLSFCFNKKKEVVVKNVPYGDMIIVEAIV
ncbi:MAG: AAA-like domain-containing protein [Eubacteriales bacterium]|nr:AAA-like domain-containing protein [Eubacteriales bacterium]